MEEFIAYLVKNLVDNPDAVKVESKQGEKALLVEIRVDPSDIAKVIGRGGKTIQAVRTLAMITATRAGFRIRVEIVEDKKEEPEAEVVEEVVEEVTVEAQEEQN